MKKIEAKSAAELMEDAGIPNMLEGRPLTLRIQVPRKIKGKTPIKIKTDHYLHLAQFDPQKVLAFANRDRTELLVVTLPDGVTTYRLKMSSPRYHVFKQSSRCADCGLRGLVMMLDLQIGSEHNIPHFNLYGHRRNELILFTKDHIIPKSKGGSNHSSNFQTMCSVCNQNKKDNVPQIETITFGGKIVPK